MLQSRYPLRPVINRSPLIEFKFIYSFTDFYFCKWLDGSVTLFEMVLNVLRITLLLVVFEFPFPFYNRKKHSTTIP